MAKKPTISSLKKKLDKVFSEYIRRRYADPHTGMTTCFTCGVKKHWKELQAGHFMSRRHHSTRFDEFNVQTQCQGCNIWNQGQQWKFGQYLDMIYGHGTAEELELKSKKTVKMGVGDYLYMIEEYGRKIKELDEQ